MQKDTQQYAPPWFILPVIVLSQFFCTSLWFATNGVMDDLIPTFQLSPTALGHLTSSVQLGFITGTLSFAILTIADRFSPSKVFFYCALTGSLFNLALIWEGNSLLSMIALRFLVGFCLAGIYPVGMKIAADYFDRGLGKSLGYLVGALVIGTALPHLLKEFSPGYSWKSVIAGTSILAVSGGFAINWLIPDGPFRKPGGKWNPRGLIEVFRIKEFRRAAFGYFGHMWELYAFWTFVPVMISAYASHQQIAKLPVSLLSFLVIGIGGLGCVAGGYASLKKGSAKIAGLALTISGICCLVSPWLFEIQNTEIFFLCLLLWGLSVIPDSPLFSTLVAKNAIPEYKGTALTIVNCIGFAITIISIQLLTYLWDLTGSYYIFLILFLGPAFGLLSFRKSIITSNH